MTVADLSSHRADIQSEIADFCVKWRVVELSLYGSAVQGPYDLDSDINLLVTFEPGTTRGLLDIAQMEMELKELFGREVAILTRRGVEMSSNPFRRREILNTTEVLYAPR